MRKLLYIGNKLEKHGATPTSIDVLSVALVKEGFKIRSVSSFKNKSLRLTHMLLAVLLNFRKKDVVLIDTYSTLNFWYAVLCARLCRILSVPYIFILHGGGLSKRFQKSSKSILNLFYQAKANVVPSYFLKDVLKEFAFDNLVYIPNSINLSQYEFKKRNTVKPKLLWVRAFDKTYHPEMALEVLEIVMETNPEAELCMVGPEKDGSLRAMTKTAELKNLPVQFKGKLSKEEWIRLSEEYDIFINTARVDNAPISLIEAMALGLPVVSTRVGGIPYLLRNKEHALLVDSENVKEMAAAINSLINHPSYALEISNKARKEAEKYDWKKVKELWLDLLC